MNWIESFRKELEKNALIGAVAVNAGLGALEMGGNLSENKAMTKLTPLRKNNQHQLSSSSQYQFEGGKHTNLKSMNQPVLS